MAKYYSSTFGKISGRHGNAVAVIMKDGTTYLREYKKPSNPRTDKQQAHRAKFALSSRALVPFNPIFKDTMGVTNGISTARSHAFNNAIVGEYPSFFINYEKLMFSFGPIEKLHSVSMCSNEGVVTLKWDFKKMYNCNADDSINIVIFNKDANQSAHLKDVALRSEKKCEIDIHDSWTKSELYLWVYVSCGDKKSDSEFVGGLHGEDNGEGKGNCESIEKDEAIDYAMHSGVYKSFMSFVVLMYNIIVLFKKEVVQASAKGYGYVLNLSSSCMLYHVGCTTKVRELGLSLKHAITALYGVMYNLKLDVRRSTFLFERWRLKEEDYLCVRME